MVDHTDVSTESHRQGLDPVLFEFENTLTKSVESSFQKYLGDDWEYLVNRRKPYRAIDILYLLDKHWISVFSSILPKYSHRYIIDALDLLKARMRGGGKGMEEEKLKELLQNIQILFGHTPRINNNNK